MKKHSFSEDDVFMFAPRFELDKTWNRFINIANELGYVVKVTGGTYLSHQIVGADSSDFYVILDLLRNK